MAVSAGMIAKAAATVLSNEKLRKGVGWTLVAILSPVIVLIALLCSIGSGGADHNNQAVAASFYGVNYSTEVPAEFRYHIEEMRTAFSLLDSAMASVNGQTESGNGLDPIRIKAVFYALCFGEDAPSARAASRFVECFYTWETRTRTVDIENGDGTVTSTVEEYTVAVPVSLYQAYANLEAELGRTITEDDKSNINHIYSMIAGAAGGGNYNGEFLRGDGSSIDLDVSAFTDPNSKNAADLVTYAIHAWESGWGYVWGTYGDVLTESLFAYKLDQYPDGVGNYEDFIRANWLGGRTTDCVGLIKGYGWLSPETMTIDYGTHGMPDIGANQMYYSATESGTIDTMPDIPGLAVWHDGHIGVYIGGGQVVEAMGKKYCHNSPTLDEAPLQQAILAVLNTAMADKNSLIRQITAAMETELIPFPGGTMSLGDIECRLRVLEQQFQTLLEKATDDPAAYGGQFKEILDEQTFLKEKRSVILANNNEQAKANQRIMDAAQTLGNASPYITEWDESAVRQLVETVKILSKDEVAVTLKGGIEICQKIMY